MPQSILPFVMLFLVALSIFHAATFASESHSNSTPSSPITVIPTSSRFMPSHVSTADRSKDAKKPSLMVVTTTDIPRSSAGSTAVSKTIAGKIHPGTVSYIPTSINTVLGSPEVVIPTTSFITKSSEASTSIPKITTTVKHSVTTYGPMTTGSSKIDHKNQSIMVSTTYSPQMSTVTTSFPKATMMAHPVIPSTVMSTSTSPTHLTSTTSKSLPPISSTPSIRAKRSELQHQQIFRMKRSRPRKTAESLMEALLAAHDQAIENENWSNNRDRSPIDRSQTADYLDDLPFDSYSQANQNGDLTMGDPENDDADIPLQEGHLPPSPLIFYPILGSNKMSPSSSSSSSSSSSYSPPSLGHRWPLRSSLIRDNGNLNVDGFGDIMPIERRKRDFKYISKPFNMNRPIPDQVFLKKLAELLAERKTHSNHGNTNSFSHFNGGQTIHTGYRPAWLDR